jgi:dATP pyrophosphohydrolase
MSRAKFQVLIIPFRIVENGVPEFAVTKRSDMDVWQFLSGGGEDDETPHQAAKREANEEGGILHENELLELDSMASIPATCFGAHKEWGSDVYVVPEYTFGADIKDNKLTLSSEHTELRWLKYEEAYEKLEWDSNKIALWELNERITNG